MPLRSARATHLFLPNYRRASEEYGAGAGAGASQFPASERAFGRAGEQFEAAGDMATTSARDGGGTRAGQGQHRAIVGVECVHVHPWQLAVATRSTQEERWPPFRPVGQSFRSPRRPHSPAELTARLPPVPHTARSCACQPPHYTRAHTHTLYDYARVHLRVPARLPVSTSLHSGSSTRH